MSNLLVARGLPNPTGKDRQPPYPPTNDQLNNEWMEFTNPTRATVSLEGVTISDYTFDRACSKTGEHRLMVFSGGLAPSHSVRVHTGSGTIWQEGTIWHLYAGSGNYVWNNRCGDTAVLRTAAGDVVDWASYDPEPLEGTILNRVPGTNKLSAARPARIA